MLAYTKGTHPTLKDQVALYASKNISSGEMVFDAKSLPLQDANDKYAITLAEGKYLNTRGNVIMYLNHSCSPTLVFDKQLLRFTTSREVNTGEMLTFDYATTEITLSEPFNCSCGATNCRGRIE